MSIGSRWIIPIVASIFALAACHFGESGSASLPKPRGRESPEAMPADNRVSLDPHSYVTGEIHLADVRMRPIEFVIEATGQLQPNANAVTRVSAPVAGKVTSVGASVGEAVRPGQMLATITSQEIGALVTELFKSETEIDSDLSRDLLDIDYHLKQAQAELMLCRKQYERSRLLLEEKIASLADVEKSHTDVEKHELMIAALEERKARTRSVAENKKRMARAALEQKLTILGMPAPSIAAIMRSRSVVSSIPIPAPQAGFVLERNINVGELVDPSRTLFVVDDIDNLWLVADIFEQDLERVQVGQKVEFSVDSFPKERFTGRLDFVAGTLNPETRTLAVRAVIPNPHLKLKPKMFARMKIFAGSHKVLAIPKAAVQDAGSRKVVYVPVSKTSFEEHEVTLGEENGEYVEVLSGLGNGARVVTDGSFSLRSQSLKRRR